MKFIENQEELDYRSIFANRILKLIYEKHSGDLDKAIIEAESFFNDFQEIIDNIYELIDTEIPLYHYYQLLKYGFENWSITEEEYKTQIELTKKACKLYYDKTN